MDVGLLEGLDWEVSRGFLRVVFPGPATGVIWALRAESCKQGSKMGPRALPAPGPKKSKTESKKSENT